jgi:hypothetical protein
LHDSQQKRIVRTYDAGLQTTNKDIITLQPNANTTIKVITMTLCSTATAAAATEMLLTQQIFTAPHHTTIPYIKHTEDPTHSTYYLQTFKHRHSAKTSIKNTSCPQQQWQQDLICIAKPSRSEKYTKTVNKTIPAHFSHSRSDYCKRS